MTGSDADGERTWTRRRALGALGALGGLAGCTELAPTEPYRPPETVRTRRAEGSVQPTGTPPSGRLRPVYESAVTAVGVVRADGGLGTCYAVDDRHLVTNQHVVEDADTVTVQYARDDWVTASVVATDVVSDLAVIRGPRPAYVEPLSLATYPPAVGQELVVIGTPFGLRSTLSTGAVSGVNRVLEAPSGFSIPGAVQTDAPVNPGNSGGPMLSLDGEVLGVITAGGGENIAFGIPPQLVRRVVPDLIEFGDYQHPFLGVSVQDVTPPVARANGLSAVRGVAVTRVVEDGPVDGVLRPNADTARVGGTVVPTGGDVVVAVGDTRVNDLGDLLIHLAFRTFPGDEVTLGVVREGTERTVTATVGVRPV